MTGQFGLDDGGLHPLSQIHGEVADGLGQLTHTDAPHPGELPPTLGHIASSMHQALGGAIESRGGTFQATQRSSDTMAGHLRQAHDIYMGADDAGARDITTASNVHTSADSGGTQGFAGGSHHGGNDIQELRGVSGETSGAGSGSSGTGGSSGTPAGAAAPGSQPTGATQHGDATSPAASAAPTSAHDAAGGVGGAAATGQSLSQTLGQAGQHAGSLGQAVGQGLEGTSQTSGQLPQQIMQAASQLGGATGEHGALGASAESVQALAHRSDAPDDQRDHRGAEPHDDAPPPDDDPDHHDPDDQWPPDDRPHDPPPQPPVPPPSSPVPGVPPRQPSGRPDPRKV